MEPHEVLASESQERMLLVVEPAKLDAVLAICAKWGVLATAIGVVTQQSRPGRLVINWHGQTVVDVPPGSLVDDGPVYARPDARAQRPVAAAGRPRRDAAPPGRRRGAARHGAAHDRLAEPVRQDLDHRAVRPVRAGQHRARPARGRRHPAHRPGDRPGRRALGGRQRAVRPARPVRGREAGARRGVPQRRRHRRDAGRRHGLPELRLARGPRRDVAVRRGGARPRRRLPGARHPGHRRQRQLLQPDRHGRRSTRRRSSASWASSTNVASRVPMGFAQPRRPDLPARRDARGALRLRVGPRDARPPRRHARRPWTWRPSSASPPCWPSPPPPAW